jgi:hypothetical protein
MHSLEALVHCRQVGFSSPHFNLRWRQVRLWRQLDTNEVRQRRYIPSCSGTHLEYQANVCGLCFKAFKNPLKSDVDIGLSYMSRMGQFYISDPHEFQGLRVHTRASIVHASATHRHSPPK